MSSVGRALLWFCFRRCERVCPKTLGPSGAGAGALAPQKGLVDGAVWTWFQLSPPDGEKPECKVVVMSDPAEWRVADLSAVPSSEVTKLKFAAGSGAEPSGVALRASKFCLPYISSAQRAFPGFVVTWLRLLMKHDETPGA